MKNPDPFRGLPAPYTTQQIVYAAWLAVSKSRTVGMRDVLAVVWQHDQRKDAIRKIPGMERAAKVYAYDAISLHFHQKKPRGEERLLLANYLSLSIGPYAQWVPIDRATLEDFAAHDMILTQCGIAISQEQKTCTRAAELLEASGVSTVGECPSLQPSEEEEEPA